MEQNRGARRSIPPGAQDLQVLRQLEGNVAIVVQLQGERAVQRTEGCLVLFVLQCDVVQGLALDPVRHCSLNRVIILERNQVNG